MQTIERAALLGLGLLALAFGGYRVACIARGLRGFRDAARGRTARRLRLMKDVQARNEEREQKWREHHAAVCQAETGNEGTRSARNGHR